ncbi:flagellar assembly protein FliX [Methylopila turkensis]|uniref:Flagellar assembly protein FliX n=1 Tax=Methylopila turkensis TaxID=1437816 RepID=A0A9W6JKD5_9HYPH|nr:flagellar assembly protein FliX [Methylopila turkensis]GLK78797.1 flagellar assembly protein FliX [Methylopila turkensis]
MRIEGPGRLTPGGAAASRAPAAGSGFRLGDAPTSSPAGAPTAVRQSPGIDALLALQAVQEPPAERRRRELKRGRGLLDSLDELKIATLEGRADLPTLTALADRLAARSEQTGDRGLDDALAAIELRARVELAKRGA